MNKKKAIIRHVRRGKAYQSETNDAAANKILKGDGGQHNCTFCPPWKDENKVTRTPKRGAKKPKYKNRI